MIGVIGRRGGKSRAISVLATYIAGLCEHPALVRGETGVVLIIAPDQRQATIVLDYVTANFESSPILKQLIEVRTERVLRLNNGVAVEVRASDYRTLRGPTYLCVIGDEIAFWMTDPDTSSNPDSAILEAVRPGLSTTGGPAFLISSPYARKGELWNIYRKHFGPSGDPLLLVAQAPSRVMNATLPQGVIDRATERDPLSAAAEYGAQFRTDLEQFVTRESVLACVVPGLYERPHEHYRWYFCFADPSGGSADSFTCAIGHRDVGTGQMLVDALREVRPPFSPEAVCAEYASLCKSYNITKIIGDRYAGEWPR